MMGTWTQTQPGLLSQLAGTIGSFVGLPAPPAGDTNGRSSRLATSALPETASLQEEVTFDRTSSSRSTVVDLELLEAVTATVARQTFIAIWQAIDWDAQTPSAVATAVRLAVSVDAPLLARELAARGHALHPTSDELARMARVLAPPTVSAHQASSRPGIRADRDWLRLHRDAYRGQWVALRDGVLLASAPSAEALLDEVGDVRGTGILVTPVW